MGVIYLPEPERKPQRPVASADSYLLGTQWMSDDGSIWEVDWDNQDKRHMWVLLTDRTNRSEADEACESCSEGWGQPNECRGSKRPCGHHCNHLCDQDACCWCPTVINSDGEEETG